MPNSRTAPHRFGAHASETALLDMKGGKPFPVSCRWQKLRRVARRRRKTRTFHRALHRSMHWTLYYCFEDDFAWFCNANPYW
jgi:hypothetical protein